MVRVALGTIHICIHLIACHEAEEVGCDLGRIRHSIVAFDDTTILGVGVVIDIHTGEVAVLGLIKHLLEGGKSTEYGIGALAYDDHFACRAVLSYGEGMTVITLLREHITLERDALAFAVGKVSRTINAEIEGVLTLYCLAGYDRRDAMLREHLFGTVECIGVYTTASHDVNLSREGCDA